MKCAPVANPHSYWYGCGTGQNLKKMEATAGIEPAYTALQDLLETFYFYMLAQIRFINQRFVMSGRQKRVLKNLNRSTSIEESFSRELHRHEERNMSRFWRIGCAAVLLSFGCANVEGGAAIYWSDGDPGRFVDVKFRLANVDAPEAGGVGSVGGAKCEAERGPGYQAKAFMVEMTRGREITVTRDYGKDRYGRSVVGLDVDGADVSERGIAANHLRPWPHKGQKALTEKPDWC